jgi:hypothetical protein
MRTMLLWGGKAGEGDGDRARELLLELEWEGVLDG